MGEDGDYYKSGPRETWRIPLADRAPQSSTTVPEIPPLLSLFFRLITVLFKCKCGRDGHLTLVSTYISVALSSLLQGNQPAWKFDNWGWFKGHRSFWSQKDAPWSLISATCQLYDLGKFLNFLDSQFPHCKRGSRTLPLQHYLKIKGNESDAPSTGLCPWSSKISLPSLCFILVSGSILSAWTNSSSSFGLASLGWDMA